MELVARGRLLPALSRTGEDWTARWQPVTEDPEDTERLRALVHAIPPLVRSELVFSYEGNPVEAIFGDLVAALVDALSRSVLAGSGPRRARSAPGAWLAALMADDPRADADPWELAAPHRRASAANAAGLARRRRGRSSRALARSTIANDLGGPVRTAIDAFGLQPLALLIARVSRSPRLHASASARIAGT